MSTSAENRSKYAAFGFTVGFHILFFLLFIYVVFVTPVPPFAIPPSIVLEWNNGMEEGGSAPGIAAATASAMLAPGSSPEAIIRDASERSVFIKADPQSKKELNENAAASAEEKASAELLNAIAILKTKRDAKNNTTNGASTTPGDGRVTGTSETPGLTESGKPGLNLAGRNLLSKELRLTDAVAEGIVVVEIVVNEEGKVIRATPGQRGSTTINSALLAKARQASLTLRFNESPDGLAEQRGTYTYVFTLE